MPLRALLFVIERFNNVRQYKKFARAFCSNYAQSLEAVKTKLANAFAFLV